MEKILNHPSYDILQHRQEDSRAVYVRGDKNDNTSKHRQEHGHAVYVNCKNEINRITPIINNAFFRISVIRIIRGKKIN